MLAIYGPGSARDHACALRLSRECGVGRFRFYMAGTNAILTRSPWTILCRKDDFIGAARSAREDAVDVVLITDATMLTAGAADAFLAEGVTVLGPDSQASAIEGHKAVMKRLVRGASVRTPQSWYFDSMEPAFAFLRENWSEGQRYVVKTDEFIQDPNLRTMLPTNLKEALVDVGAEVRQLSREHRSAGVVVEQWISGFETSVHVLWDGNDYVLLPPVRDYKPVRDGDRGPNTNGAAALACGRGFDYCLESRLRSEIIEPILNHLSRTGYSYRGFLYFGIMLTDEGPMVLELNVRPGNPEFVALLGLLKTDFSELIELAARGKLQTAKIAWKSEDYCGVVFALARGYPEIDAVAPTRIDGLEEMIEQNNIVAEGVGEDEEGGLVVTGGRVVAAIGSAPAIESVRHTVYADLNRVRFEGKHYRSDLGFGLADNLFAAPRQD